MCGKASKSVKILAAVQKFVVFRNLFKAKMSWVPRQQKTVAADFISSPAADKGSLPPSKEPSFYRTTSYHSSRSTTFMTYRCFVSSPILSHFQLFPFDSFLLEVNLRVRFTTFAIFSIKIKRRSYWYILHKITNLYFSFCLVLLWNNSMMTVLLEILAVSFKMSEVESCTKEFGCKQW